MLILALLLSERQANLSMLCEWTHQLSRFQLTLSLEVLV